jgi:hypothetical protein
MDGVDHYDGPDRRQNRRRPSPVNRLIRAELSLEGLDSEDLYLYLVDMSEGGIRITADRPLPPGLSVGLCFGLEGFPEAPSPRLAVTVQRAWDRPLAAGTWVTGLRFIDLDDQAQQAVQQLLQGVSVEGRRKRFRLREPISASLQLQAEGKWVVVVPMDLNSQGIRVRAYAQAELDQELGLMVRFPEKKGHVFRARVQQVQTLDQERQELNLTFLEPPDQFQDDLQAYIDQVCGVSEPAPET